MIRHWIGELKWWKKYWNKEKKMTDDMNISHEPVEHIAEAAREAHKAAGFQADRKPQVAEQIDNLAQTITVSENLVESLHTRLSAVSNPLTKEDTPPRPATPMVPVAAGVHAQNERLLDVNLRIEAILQSLEV